MKTDRPLKQPLFLIAKTLKMVRGLWLLNKAALYTSNGAEQNSGKYRQPLFYKKVDVWKG